MALLVMAAPPADEKGLVLLLVEVVITPKSWPLGFAGGVKHCTAPPARAATWFSFMLAWLAALMAISPFKAFTERRGWMKATMLAEEESNGVAGTVFVGNGADAASGIAVWNCIGTTAAVGGAAGDVVDDGDAATTDVVEDGGAATTVESTATAPAAAQGPPPRGPLLMKVEHQVYCR
jgi:hypothetical protein